MISRDDFDRLEKKIDDVLFRLGADRPRSQAEIARLAAAKIIELQNQRPRRKSDHEREKRIN